LNVTGYCGSNYLYQALKGRVPGLPMGGTTGVSLEQGLGLTDVPRGSLSGRRLTTFLVRVVSAVYDCAPSLSPALRSLHGRPGCSFMINSIYR